MKSQLTSKFILKGIGKVVEGIMSDSEKLEKAEKRIKESTEEKFREYNLMRYKAHVESYRRVVD